MKRISWLVSAMLLCVGASVAVAEDHEQAEAPERSWLNLAKDYDFQFTPWGYVRMMYDSVENDDRFDFIGRNDGFVLENARVGFDLSIEDQLEFAFSVEGASDLGADTNTPLGELDVRVRDAYVRYDPWSFLGLQAGQFKAPFAAEELRSRSDLTFVSRAVGQEGVLPGRGLEEQGVALDRQLGVMLSPRDPIAIAGKFSTSYFLMAANGNGDNELLNDNDSLAWIGRLELNYCSLASIGAAFLFNERTSGEPPNQADDEDTGYAVDISITPKNAEIFFQWVEIETEFETVAEAVDRTQRAFHAQVAYTFDTPWMTITPGYRYAVLDPFSDVEGDSAGLALADQELTYHTIGARFGHLSLPLAFLANYTITEEEDSRELDNDRIQLLMQVEF